MSTFGLFFGVTVNSTIKSFFSTGRRMLSCISCIFEFLLATILSVTYALVHCNRSLYISEHSGDC